MAWNAAVALNVRPGGNDANGGGFRVGGTGQDYSLQDAAQVVFNGSGVTASTAGSSATITLSGISGDAAHVHNLLRITGGTNFIVGVYEILSQTGTSWTLDRTCTSGAGSGMTGNMGGALASPGQAGGDKANYGSQTQVDVNIKNGTYNVSTASTNVSNGCAVDTTFQSTGDARWEGYNTTPRDLGSPPTLVATGSIANFQMLRLGTRRLARNLIVNASGYSNARPVWLNDTNAQAELVWAVNGTNGGIYADNICQILACRASGCSGSAGAIHTTNDGAQVVGCEAHDNTCHGFSLVGGAHWCLSYANSTSGRCGFWINNAQPVLSNCVAYGNASSGFQIGAYEAQLINCLAEANGSYGFGTNSSTRNMSRLLHCAGYANTPGNVEAIATQWGGVINFVALSASAFVDAANRDFRLNSAAGGGALCIGTGFPQSFHRGLTSGYPSIGAAFPLPGTGGAPATRRPLGRWHGV